MSIALTCGAMASVSHADDVTLAWDANTDPAVTGYKLYYGTANGVYPSSIDVGNVTQYTVGGLLSGQTYYFAVTACSGSNNQSGYSDEISYTLPLADSDGDGVDDSEDVFPANPAEWADHDYDGTGDNADIDDDNDGVADAEDAYPYNATEWVDTDGDNVGNNADLDDDGDGVNDGQDRFPLDSAEWADLDDDGIGDNADTDDDADGIGDDQDAFPTDPLEWVDTDRDTIGNNADPDDDNDGMPDDWEIANQLDPLVNDGNRDEDGDGISNLDEYITGGNPFLHEANQVPDSPLLLSPVGGDIMTATPQLEVDAFSDPDFGDTHARTQWQIIQAIDDHCVFDVTSDTAVTALAVPKIDSGRGYRILLACTLLR